jgi:hypothetical protein
MTLEERQPAFGIGERRKQTRQVLPREFHAIPRRTIT